MFLGFWISISPDTEEQTNLCFEWDICIINHYCFSDSLFCDFKGIALIVHPEMKTVIICSVITPSSETCTIFFLWNAKWDLAQKSLKLETVELQKRHLLPCERNKSIIFKSLPCLFIFKPGVSRCIAPVLKSKMSVNRIYFWLFSFFFPYLVFQRLSLLFCPSGHPFCSLM